MNQRFFTSLSSEMNLPIRLKRKLTKIERELSEPALRKKRQTESDVQLLASETLTQLGSETGKSTLLTHLTSLSKKLTKCREEDLRNLAVVLKQGVTAFEFQKSKLADSLGNWLFKGGKHYKKRAKLFVDVMSQEDAMTDLVRIMERSVR
jgi:hypothetical protein